MEQAIISVPLPSLIVGGNPSAMKQKWRITGYMGGYIYPIFLLLGLFLGSVLEHIFGYILAPKKRSG
jgi:hypothetical protein